MLSTLTLRATDSWTADQLRTFDEQGYLFFRSLFSADELATIDTSLSNLLDCDEEDGMHRERERSGAVRQVYLAHRHSPAFCELAHNPRITRPVQQILGDDFYIWHSKINVKDAFEGTVWLWHQDYGYWVFDGVGPRLVSVMILLDRATINNGALMVIPGSHRWGDLALKQAYAVGVVSRVSWRMVKGPNLVGSLVVVRIVRVAGV